MAAQRHKPPNSVTRLMRTRFDASFTDMFMAWCSGGCVLIAPDEVRRDAARLADFIRLQRIERLNLPFAALDYLAGYIAESGEGLPTVQEVISTAEQLRITPAVRAFFEADAELRLQNQYGPTETHVVTALEMDASPASWPG